MGSSPPAPASPAQVVLHLGVHKTASTYLQKTCLANRDELARQGCAYFGPDRLRGDLRLPALERPQKAIARKIAPFRAVLQAERAAGQRLLISNENVLGGPRPPVLASGPQLYPQAQANIDALLTALDLEDVTLALALRHPLDLLVSAWGHQYLAGRPVTFEAFCEGVAPRALRWSEMVARLRSCARVGDILLWRYEDYHALGPRVIAHLAGLPAGTVLMRPPAASSSNYLTGPSARAIDALEVVLAARPELSAKDALRRAMRQFPKSESWPGPRPFALEQWRAAEAQYQADWQALQASPGVTCQTP